MVDGIVLTPNWAETLRGFKVGEKRTYQRPDITTTKARILASRMNRDKTMRFSVKSDELDEFVTIKREK